jgi:hypothetical protein
MQEHVALHGGTVIFAYKIARFVGCALLLGVSIATLMLETGYVDFGITGKHLENKPKQKHSENGMFTKAEWLQVALCITTVRVSALISVSI